MHNFEMKSVRLLQVPEYLREGAFYQSLDLSSDDEIQVPKDALKPNEEIWSDADLFHYLRSLRYWGVDDISRLCAWFVLLRNEYCLSELAEFHEVFPTLTMVMKLLHLPDHSMRLHSAIRADAIIVAECMVSLGYLVSSNECDLAAKLSTGPMLEVLCARNVRSKQQSLVSLDTVKIALSAGNIKAVLLLEKRGLNMKHDLKKLEIVDRDGDRGVAVGNLVCFKYALSHGCVISNKTAIKFARANVIDVLRYVHEHGGYWDEETTAEAAKHGALECLKYAHEHGCPTTVRAYHTARAARQHTCVAYLQEKGIQA